MTNMLDELIGCKFGKLTLNSLGPRVRGRLAFATCDCGNNWSGFAYNLTRGLVKSCGCFRSKKQRDKFYKDGRSYSPLYSVWKGMHRRCNDKTYQRYGGRGISVCQEWMEFWSFHDWSIQNGYREGFDIDRENNDGNYDPDNCRWVSKSVNQRNRSDNKIIKVLGESKCVAEWSQDARCSVCEVRIRMRLKRGWSAEDAVLKPSGKYVKRDHGV